MLAMKNEGEVKCSTCGRAITPDEYKNKWRNCYFCEKPICFNCTHYLGAQLKGLYCPYVVVRHVCEKCYPIKGGMREKK